MLVFYDQLTLSEARQMQNDLAQRVITTDVHGPITYVAGVDVGYNKKTNEQTAAAVVLNAMTNNLIEIATATTITTMPYITGFLSFREIPTIVAALEKLTIQPDLILCDGQGIAHPRRFGIACHLGVLLDKPTIGCGKTLLVGHADEPDTSRGSQTPLIYRSEIIGIALRTRDKCRPVYVSVGHRVSLESAVAWILRCADRYRLPTPIHMADRTVDHVIAAAAKKIAV